MNEFDVVNAALAVGSVGGAMVATAIIMKNLPAAIDSVREWHLGVKRLNFLKHQFDQTRQVENTYLYPPAVVELPAPQPSTGEQSTPEPGRAA